MQPTNLKAGIIGFGHLGQTNALAFAELGLNVLGMESDQRKLACLG